MSKRLAWIDVVGVILGLVAIGTTVFAVVSIFGRGPAAMAWPGRPRDIVESITEGVGRGIRDGMRAVRPVAGSWTGGWQSAEGEETVSGSQTSVSVNNVSGRIRVTSWDGETVRVRYVKQARTAADLKDFVIEVRGAGDTVSVRPVYEPAGGLGRFGSVDFDISVPRRISRLSLHNVSGEIEVDDVAGVVDKELGTVSGSIKTSGAGDLSAKTTSGAIEFEFSGDALQASSVSGKIQGTIASLGARGADIGTISGRVEVEAFAGLDASLDLRSLSGSISCDFPVTIREQSRGKLLGTVGKGAVPLSVSTTSGSIRIQKD